MFTINMGDWDGDRISYSDDRVEELIDSDDMVDKKTDVHGIEDTATTSDDCFEGPERKESYSFVEFSDGYQNVCVKFQRERERKDFRSVCDTWPNFTTETYSGSDSFSISFNDVVGIRRNWRDNLRRMSTSCVPKSSGLRLVRGITKNNSMRLTTRNRSANGLLNEALLFSVSQPPASLRSHQPSMSRSPRWISAAKRELMRSRKAQRRGRHGMMYSAKPANLDPIVEEPAEDDVTTHVALNQLAISDVGGLRRNFGQNRLLSHDDQVCITYDEKPVNETHFPMEASIEDELCERLCEMPVVESDSDYLRALRESFQACHVTRTCQDSG